MIGSMMVLDDGLSEAQRPLKGGGGIAAMHGWRAPQQAMETHSVSKGRKKGGGGKEGDLHVADEAVGDFVGEGMGLCCREGVGAGKDLEEVGVLAYVVLEGSPGGTRGAAAVPEVRWESARVDTGCRHGHVVHARSRVLMLDGLWTQTQKRGHLGRSPRAMPSTNG